VKSGRSRKGVFRYTVFVFELSTSTIVRIILFDLLNAVNISFMVIVTALVPAAPQLLLVIQSDVLSDFGALITVVSMTNCTTTKVTAPTTCEVYTDTCDV